MECKCGEYMKILVTYNWVLTLEFTLDVYLLYNCWVEP